jgi:flagellar assembly factor FliW
MSNALAMDEKISVRSELLGQLEVSIEQVITFPHGIPGFPEGQKYALLPTGRDGVFWLQSADFSALSFLLVDPFQFFPGYYHIDLSDDDVARLGTTDPSRILFLSIVTLGAEVDQRATANLRAPLLVNLDLRIAHQSIRADEGFGVREVIDPRVLAGDA